MSSATATSGRPPALDDAEVFCRAGHAVRLVQGSPENFKITTAADLDRARRLAGADAAPLEFRTGQGFDVHRFAPGDHLWLCGVRIPHDRRLEGHSDADVAKRGKWNRTILKSDREGMSFSTNGLPFGKSSQKIDSAPIRISAVDGLELRNLFIKKAAK